MNFGSKLSGKSMVAICYISLIFSVGVSPAVAQDSGSLGDRLPWWEQAETQKPQDPQPKQPPQQTENKPQDPPTPPQQTENKPQDPPTPPQQTENKPQDPPTPPQQTEKKPQDPPTPAKQPPQQTEKKDPVPQVPPSALDPKVDPFKPQEDQKPDPLQSIDPANQPGVVQPPPVMRSEDTPILPPMPTPPVYQPPANLFPDCPPPMYQVPAGSPMTMHGHAPLPPSHQLVEPYRSHPPILNGGDYFQPGPAKTFVRPSGESPRGPGLGHQIRGCDTRRGLEVFVDSLYMWRESTSDQVLVRQGALDPNGSPLLYSGDMNMDPSAGIRTGFVSCGPRGTFEFAFTAINSWDTSQVFHDPVGPVSSAYPNILLNKFNTSRFSWDADFNTAEFNIHRRNNNVTWIGGVRWIELSEFLQNDINFPSRGALVPTYSIQTDNQLWGIQGGAKLHLWSSPQLRFESVVKGAWLGNTAKQSTTSLRGDSGFPAAGSSIQDRSEETSFFGEINFIGDYKIGPRVSLRSGYQLMWLTNVALAPDQIAGNDLIQTVGAVGRLGPAGARSINAQGNVFAHGAIFGIEFRR